MISRRGLLRGLLSGAASAPLVRTAAAPAESPDPLSYTTRGQTWTLRWTGWQRSRDQDVWSGVWLAHGGDVRVYSTTGGVVDTYQPGEVFNLARYGQARLLTSESGFEAFTAADVAARHALLTYLDALP